MRMKTNRMKLLFFIVLCMPMWVFPQTGSKHPDLIWKAIQSV